MSLINFVFKCAFFFETPKRFLTSLIMLFSDCYQFFSFLGFFLTLYALTRVGFVG